MQDFCNGCKQMKIQKPFEFEVAREFKTRSRLQLKTKFYRYHSEIDAKGFKHGLQPNTLVLNPSLLHNDTNTFAIDTWYAIYCRGYYVTIEQSNYHPILGPHVAKLNLQVYGGTIRRLGLFVWLGTAQINFSFFDPNQLQIKLKRAIRLREYFCCERNEDELIEMSEPDVAKSEGQI